MLEERKNYLDVPSTVRSFETICGFLYLSERDLKHKLILDLGSGGAGFAKGVHKRPELASEVVSLDPKYSGTGVEFSDSSMRSIGKELINKGLSAVASLSEHLPFKDDTFDLVVSVYAIPHHIRKYPAQMIDSILEIIRVLKHGGEARLYPVQSEDASLIEDIVKDVCTVKNRGTTMVIAKRKQEVPHSSPASPV